MSRLIKLSTFSFLETGGCRGIRFTPHSFGEALEGHVIKTLEVVDYLGNCQLKCVLTDYCVSINLGPAQPNGMRMCELSNSDHIRHPEDLKPRAEFAYSATKVQIKSGGISFHLQFFQLHSDLVTTKVVKYDLLSSHSARVA